MNPALLQIILLAAGAGIGYLVKHLQGSSTPGLPPANPTPVPAPAPVPAPDPFKGLPGLPGHPLLNSPLLATFLTQVEQVLMQQVQGQAVQVMTPSVTPKG